MAKYPQLIIGISGKIGSGKDDTANYLKGQIGKGCKIYHFAEALKRDVCMGLLGLSEKQVYEDKDSLTNLRWEDMPGVITPDTVSKLTDSIRMPISQTEDNNRYAMTLSPGGPKNGYWLSIFDQYGFITHEPGQMTAREVMQFVGTDIFRKMYSNVWVDATIRKIKKDRVPVALIPDLRFVSEAEAIKAIGGHVWRLTRNPEDQQHESETGLDGYVDWDFVLDNSYMDLNAQRNWAWKEYCHISPYQESPYDE